MEWLRNADTARVENSRGISAKQSGQEEQSGRGHYPASGFANPLAPLSPQCSQELLVLHDRMIPPALSYSTLWWPDLSSAAHRATFGV